MPKKRTKAKNSKDRKPSVKRTLEDVQQSLRDLVNNELADLEEWENNLGTSTGKPMATATPNIIFNRKNSDHDSDSTESLDNNTINQNKQPTQDQDWDNKATRTINSQASVKTPNDYSLDPSDFSLEVQSADKPKARAGHTADASNLDGPIQAEFDDDIPVLQDVASPPPSAGDDPLPKPSKARDLAIRVIAKLNIELKKKGEPGLDPTTINRLQGLLRKELEQQATFMDNTEDD